MNKDKEMGEKAKEFFGDEGEALNVLTSMMSCKLITDTYGYNNNTTIFILLQIIKDLTKDPVKLAFIYKTLRELFSGDDKILEAMLIYFHNNSTQYAEEMLKKVKEEMLNKIKKDYESR